MKPHDTTRLDAKPSNSERTFHTVPRRLVSNFLGRDEVLQKINMIFTRAESPSIVVIRALGGQGKSQVALAYCRQIKQTLKSWSVFWVDATSENTLRKDFEAIAERIKEPNETVGDDNRVEFALEKLEEWSQPWLLVFDNYDDPSSFNILQYISCGGNGHVLVTSRHAATDNLTISNNVVALQGLSEKHSAELLLQQSRIEQDEASLKHSKEIVKVMGCKNFILFLCSRGVLGEDRSRICPQNQRIL